MELIYEQFFFLKYLGGWSFIEAYNLPVGLRVWFVERLMKQLRTEHEQVETAKSGIKSSGGSKSQTLNSETQSMLNNLRAGPPR